MMNEFLVSCICLYTIYTMFLNVNIKKIYEEIMKTWRSLLFRLFCSRSRQRVRGLRRLVDGSPTRRFIWLVSERLFPVKPDRPAVCRLADGLPSRPLGFSLL